MPAAGSFKRTAYLPNRTA